MSSTIAALTLPSGNKHSQSPTLTEQPQITIRQARYAEIPAMAQTIARSFMDDVLFGERIHPHRHKYPLEMSYYFQRRFQRDWWDWSHVFVVATIPNSSTTASAGDKIIGVAQWHRQGPPSPSQSWGLHKLDPRNALWYLAQLQNHIHAQLYPNLAADPAHEDCIERSYPFLDGVWTGKREKSWYLCFLGVDPDFHGRGAGRKLVKWGLDMAEQEGVSASVIAAHGKDRFYQACGFDTYVGRCGDQGGPDNPLRDVKGGSIWFVDR